MKTLFKILAPALAAAALALRADVPLRWTVETSRAAPRRFDVYRGETVKLFADFESYGRPLPLGGAAAALYVQTNGMGGAWWTIPATVSSNRIEATLAPGSYPAGASTLNGFLGSTGTSYRAAFQARVLGSPGAAPNAVLPPVDTLDFAAIAVRNAPYLDAAAVTNAAEGVVSRDAVTRSYGAGGGTFGWTGPHTIGGVGFDLFVPGGITVGNNKIYTSGSHTLSLPEKNGTLAVSGDLAGLANAITNDSISAYASAKTNSLGGIVYRLDAFSVSSQVDEAMGDMLGANWRATYGGGAAGIVAALLAAIAFLWRNMRYNVSSAAADRSVAQYTMSTSLHSITLPTPAANKVTDVVVFLDCPGNVDVPSDFAFVGNITWPDDTPVQPEKGKHMTYCFTSVGGVYRGSGRSHGTYAG